MSSYEQDLMATSKRRLDAMTTKGVQQAIQVFLDTAIAFGQAYLIKDLASTRTD